MAEYYFVSQLPSLDGISENAELPITEAQFTELCDRYLSRKWQEVAKKITLSPAKTVEYSGSALVDAWNESERNLRFALGKARAEKMKKPFDTENKAFSMEYVKTANAAVEIENPMEAEAFLNRYRLETLEALRPTDNFSEDFIFYYALKLKLLLRMRQFDKKAGEEAYKSFYNSILSGERLEEKQ